MGRFSKVALCILFVLGTALSACGAPGASSGPSSTAQTANKDPYVIGLTADLTGPLANTHGRLATGMRVYMDEVNKRGGINGHPVKLEMDDNRSDPNTAGAHAAKYVDDKVGLIIDIAASSTQAVVKQKAAEAKIPLITMTGLPQASPPQPDPLIFSLRFGNDTILSGQLAATVLAVAEEKLKGASAPIKVLGVTVDIPGSRLTTDNALKVLAATGMQTTLEVVPLVLSDYGPLASKVMQGGYQIVALSAPGPISAGLINALQPLGYKGLYAVNLSAPIQNMLGDLKSESVFASHYLLGLDVSPEFAQAAKAYGVENNDFVFMGWLDGKVIEEAFKKVSWPPSSDKVAAAMSDLTVNLMPYQASMKWTSSDHVGSRYSQTFAWTKDKGISKVGPVFRIDSLTGKATAATPE